MNIYKNRTICIIIGCCIATAKFFHTNVYAADMDNCIFEGHGTQYDPYLITSYEDLCTLRDMVDVGNTFDGIYFEQKEDIYFPSGEIWNPIGDLSTGYAFCGCYNGNGHTLFNMYCEDTCAGFFSLLGGEVRNLGIESGIFRGNYVGSITSHGIGNCRIVNCYNKAEVIGKGRAGGIADNFPGMIIFCWNLGGVYGENDESITAGICSYGSPQISCCYDMTNDRLINESTFSGIVKDSATLNANNAASLMDQMYAQMWSVYWGGQIQYL